MYLIKAEANVQLNKLNEAKEALLVVAKRNLDIKSTNDLPSEKENLMSFIKDERARELFQEGMCLYDLRRWNERVSVYANSAPAIKFTYTNYEISNLVFPIPSAEINAGFGVTQNNWTNTLPLIIITFFILKEKCFSRDAPIHRSIPLKQISGIPYANTLFVPTDLSINIFHSIL